MTALECEQMLRSLGWKYDFSLGSDREGVGLAGAHRIKPHPTKGYDAIIRDAYSPSEARMDLVEAVRQWEAM